MTLNKLGYCFAVMAALALAGCKGGGAALKEGKLEYAPEVNAVDVMTLERKDFPRQLLSNGKASAVSRAVLKFGTSGAVKVLNVKNGQHVASGQVLAELDRPDLELSLEAAELALDKARLELYDILAGQGYAARDTSSVPSEVLDMAKMRSGYSSAVNSLESARYALSCTVLKAPFAGVVADLKVKRFDQAPSDAFCTLLDDSMMDVDFTVTESEYRLISSGLPVKVVPFSGGSRVFEGKISEINPVVDKNGQINVRARVRGAQSLLDGMNVKVTVEKNVPGQLVVPRSAVVIRDNMDVLFTYQPDGTARWVYVDILDSNRDSFVVEADKDRGAKLSVGDKVIISSNLNLADGSEVRLKD